jgi:hypothetical protein
MIKRPNRKGNGAPATPAPAAAPARLERPQPVAPEIIAVVAALLEIELLLHLGGCADAWTFPAAAAGHGWSETGRQLVSVYERGMKP